MIIKEIFCIKGFVISNRLRRLGLVLGIALAVARCSNEPAAPASGRAVIGTPQVWSSGERDMAWLAWGAAAFARAARQDSPVLLYLAAPGCEGIFTGVPAVVQSLVEERFVPIRVDPYRRPDIAAQFFTGGWPAVVLLTANGQSFAVAVDIAPRNLEMFLVRNLTYYAENRALIEQKLARPAASDTARALVVAHVYRQIHSSFDRSNGGFGQGVKFPEIEVLRFLLAYAQHNDLPEARQLAVQSLEALLNSPMIDAQTGGLVAFSFTPDWRTPVRQKDALDQAGLLLLLLSFGEAGPERYTAAALNLLDYIENHLFNAAAGGFQGRQVYLKGKGWWTDPVIYADRNALLIRALVQAHRVLKDQRALDLARTVAASLVQNGIDTAGAVRHTYGDDQVPALGLLTDQVLVSHALLDMHQLDGSPVWERQAENVMRYMESTLFDPDHSAFYAGPVLMPLDTITMRRFPYRDGMTAAGNPLAAELFLRLQQLERAQAILAGKRLSQRPGRAHASYARAMLRFDQVRQAASL